MLDIPFASRRYSYWQIIPHVLPLTQEIETSERHHQGAHLLKISTRLVFFSFRQSPQRAERAKDTFERQGELLHAAGSSFFLLQRENAFLRMSTMVLAILCAQQWKNERPVTLWNINNEACRWMGHPRSINNGMEEFGSELHCCESKHYCPNLIYFFKPPLRTVFWFAKRLSQFVIFIISAFRYLRNRKFTLTIRAEGNRHQGNRRPTREQEVDTRGRLCIAATCSQMDLGVAMRFPSCKSSSNFLF